MRLARKLVPDSSMRHEAATMNVFHRKKTWQQRTMGKVTSSVAKPAIKTGAVALTGAATLAAASAAVSSLRRKTDS